MRSDPPMIPPRGRRWRKIVAAAGASPAPRPQLLAGHVRHVPRRVLSFSLLWMLALLAFLAGCKTAEDKTPTGPHGVLTVAVEAQPSEILANGTSRLVVFTQVTDGSGFAADSTEVILLNTMGTLQRGVLYTRNGVALDTLTSDTVAGTGWIIAYARGVRDSAEIMFTR